MKQIPEEILNRIVWREKGDLEAAHPTPKELLHYPQPCDDCELTVTDRRVEHVQRLTPFPHWHTRCLHCGLYRDPDSGKFSITGEEYKAILALKKRTRTK